MPILLKMHVSEQFKSATVANDSPKPGHVIIQNWIGSLGKMLSFR